MYFEGDEHLERDPAFSVLGDRETQERQVGKKDTDGAYRFDIVIHVENAISASALNDVAPHKARIRSDPYFHAIRYAPPMRLTPPATAPSAQANRVRSRRDPPLP